METRDFHFPCLRIFESNVYLQLKVSGNVRQKTIGAVHIIYLTAIMLQSVTHDKIVSPKYHIITHDLVKYRLGNCHIGCLILYNHLRSKITSIQNCVTPFFGSVQRYLNFVRQECRRISFMFYEEMNKVLTHPFFGRQSHITVTDGIENHPFSILHTDFCIECR